MADDHDVAARPRLSRSNSQYFREDTQEEDNLTAVKGPKCVCTICSHKFNVFMSVIELSQNGDVSAQ